MSDTIGSIIKQADAHNRALAEAYFVARDHDSQARENFREEALALARDHEREAEAWANAVGDLEAGWVATTTNVDLGTAREMRDLHVHTANFLRLVAEGRVNA